MDQISITLILLVFAAIMFMWEKIPLALTSMIVCISLNITGVLDAKTTFSGFINTNVILFVAMFIVGGALFETGMANEIGGLVTKFAKTEKQLIISIMIVVGILSGVLSNTGTAAVLIPVVVGISSKSGYSRSKLLMPLVFAAALGGNLSLIGAPGNMIAQTALNNLNLSFGFFEYAKVGFPMLIVAIIFYATIGEKFLPTHTITEEVNIGKHKDYSSIPKWKKVTSLIILVLTGIITEKDAYKAIDMQTIFLFGGTLALATALDKTGAGTVIANTIMSLVGTNTSPIVILIMLLLKSCILTNFMSNTATTALLVPIGISIANKIGADPRAVLMAIVVGGSCAYATPIGMPANTMVLAPGGYKFKDYMKAGLPLIIISIIMSTILLPIFFPFF